MQSDILKARSLSKKGEYNNGTVRLTGGYSATGYTYVRALESGPLVIKSCK